MAESREGGRGGSPWRGCESWIRWATKQPVMGSEPAICNYLNIFTTSIYTMVYTN